MVINVNYVGLVKDVELDKDGVDKSCYIVNEKLELILIVILIFYRLRIFMILFVKNKIYLNWFYLSFGFFFFKLDFEIWKIIFLLLFIVLIWFICWVLDVNVFWLLFCFCWWV